MTYNAHSTLGDVLVNYDRLEFTPSPGLLKEIGSVEPRKGLSFTRLASARSVAEYVAPLIDTVYGREIIERLAGLGPGLRILDIGFGEAESSLYLANEGHEVVSLDPSPVNCARLERATEHFGLDLRVVQGPAEALDQLEAADFDVCLFNSCLHHCDQPVRALTHCRNKLAPQGRVLALNEPILKPYTTRNRAYRRIEEAPQETGNYGGNEHLYHFRDYLDQMEQAGFGQVRFHVHVRHRYPLETILYDVQKQDRWSNVVSDEKLLAKFAVMLGLNRLERIPAFEPPAMRMLARMSLIPASFEALP